MTPNPYSVAFEKALAEVTEIAARFEQLRVRKSHLEHLVAALQPMFSAEAGFTSPVVTHEALPEEHSGPHVVNETETFAGEQQGTYSYLDVPAPLPEGDGDPFQRRVKTSFRFRGLAAQRSY